MSIVLKPENVVQLVFFIRGEKVLLDADLAMLYGVEPRVLNQAVARNRKRFPADFMFQVSAREYDALTSQIVISDKDDARGASALRSQIVISKKGRGGRRYLPYAFTEQGVAMLSSVLRSARAVEVNIAIMRTFVQLRRLMDTNRDSPVLSRSQLSSRLGTWRSFTSFLFTSSFFPFCYFPRFSPENFR